VEGPYVRKGSFSNPRLKKHSKEGCPMRTALEKACIKKASCTE